MDTESAWYVYRAASGLSHIVESYTASQTRCGRPVDASDIPQSAPQGQLCTECAR